MKRNCRAIIDVLQEITWDRSSDAEKMHMKKTRNDQWG